MKNLFNLGFVVLLLVVLGCNCQQKLQEIANQSKTPSSTPSTSSNTSSSPTSSSSPASKSSLSLDKYNQIKNGMTYKEVVAIIGSDGTETSSSGEGKYKVTSYQWKGGDYEYIYGVFMGDKLTSKTQANLK
jgi:Beta-lactamase inhibitor (BLIP)